MLEESKALVETLDWTVVDSICVGLNSNKRKELLGTGKIAEIKDLLSKESRQLERKVPNYGNHCKNGVGDTLSVNLLTRDFFGYVCFGGILYVF